MSATLVAPVGAASNSTDLQFDDMQPPLNITEGSQETVDISFTANDLNDNNTGNEVEFDVSLDANATFTDVNSVNSDISVSQRAEVQNGSIVFSLQENAGGNYTANITLDRAVIDASDPNDGDLVVEVTDTGGADNTRTFTGAIDIQQVEDPFFDVQDFEAPAIAAQGDDVTGTATIVNVGNETDTQTVNLTVGTETLASEEVTLDPGADQDVTLTGEVTNEPGEYDIAISTDNNTESRDFTVTDPDDDAFITGDLRDEFGDRIDNASDIPIRIFADGQEIQESPIFVDGTNDDYTQRVPVSGDQTEYTVRVLSDEVENITGTEFESFARTANVSAGATERFDVRLVRVLLAGEIDVVQTAESAVAGGNDTIGFDISIFDDQDGEPFQDTVEVDINTDNSSAVEITDGTTTFTGDQDNIEFETDGNGELTLTTSSTEIQSVDYTFTAATNDSVTETRTKEFVAADGTGVIPVQVKDIADADTLEDATVWAVQEDTFLENTRGYNLTNTFDDDEIFVRVIDDDTDEPVSVNDYDFTAGQFTGNEALSSEVEQVDQLNESDRSVGSGFSVTANEVDGNFTFDLTPVENSNYTVQFTNVTDDPADADFEDADSFTATANLTAAATAERASDTDAEPVATTNDDGQATLINLAAEKEGIPYVVLGERVDYATAFVTTDVTPRSDTPDAPNERLILLEEIDVEPDNVNITQVGTHPPLAETGGTPNVDEIVEFDDQTDDTFQQVPRDGTVDVIEVEASASGFGEDAEDIPVSTEVTVDFNTTVDGQFVGVLGGDNVTALGDEQLTVETGDDGSATLLFETNRNDTTTEAVKTATLEEDSSVTDSSNVTFVGVLTFESGSISGIVTNEQNEPLENSIVFTEEFVTQGGDIFTLTPDDENLFENLPQNRQDAQDEVLDAEFTLTDEADNETYTLTGERLQSFSLSDTVPRISTPANVTIDDFSLIAFPSEQEGQAQYTLPVVPAQDGDGVDYTRLTAAQFGTGDTGAGTSSNPVRVDFTEEGNVVIVGAEPLADSDFQLSGLDPAQATVEQGTNVTFSTIVTNQGDLTATQTVEAFVEPLGVVDEFEIELAGGETAILETTVDTSDVDPGDYTHGFESEDDRIEGSLTINDTSNGSGLSQYNNDDDVVDLQGLNAAFSDWQDGEIGIGELNTVFTAWQNDEGV